MPKPADAEPQKGHRWYAIECNNRAWRLAESASRTAAEDADMLCAAHMAAYHWSKVGTELNIARAQMLLGQVHALLGHGSAALEHARAAFDYVVSHASPAWEIAFAHAVLANAALAAGHRELYHGHHREALALGEALADEEEREIFRATFRQVPVPA